MPGDYDARFDCGPYAPAAQGRPYVYVSRGIGTSSKQVRFLCRPEVAILTLASR
jgi:predicted MPP superfamily phosphohydrolase